MGITFVTKGYCSQLKLGFYTFSFFPSAFFSGRLVWFAAPGIHNVIMSVELRHLGELSQPTTIQGTLIVPAKIGEHSKSQGMPVSKIDITISSSCIC